MGTLLLIHAHPDDESIFTGGIMRRAYEEGHRVVLVTCTRGENGEAPGLDPRRRGRLGEVREAELRGACERLGVARLELLGYRDSGTAGEQPPGDCFHNAPLPEAGGRLAGILRRERPEVVVTYGEDGTYGHPDHVKAHHVTIAAVRLAGLSCPVYGHVLPRSHFEEVAERRETELGRRPGSSRLREMGVPDERIAVTVDVADLVGHKHAALAMHASQDHSEPAFATPFGQVLARAMSAESFILALGRADGPRHRRSLMAG